MQYIRIFRKWIYQRGHKNKYKINLYQYHHQKCKQPNKHKEYFLKSQLVAICNVRRMHYSRHDHLIPFFYIGFLCIPQLFYLCSLSPSLYLSVQSPIHFWCLLWSARFFSVRIPSLTNWLAPLRLSSCVGLLSTSGRRFALFSLSSGWPLRCSPANILIPGHIYTYIDRA